MRLKLKKVRWKNFLRTGNYWIEVDLCSEPLTLIVGENGAGKSTLLDAIFYALFNKPFRKINKPQLINTITASECVVEIEFDVNGHAFHVIRGMKPNVFKIFQDGTLLNEEADRRDYQSALEKYILKINHKTCAQIIALGSAIFTPFMALSSTERRNVVEDIMDLEVFSRMNALLKKKLETADNNLKDHTYKKDLTEEKIKLTEENQIRFQQSKETLMIEHTNNLKKVLETIFDVTRVLNDLEKREEELDIKLGIIPDITGKHQEVTKLRTELATSERRINKELTFFADHNVCPTCHQEIDGDFKQHFIEENQDKADKIKEAIKKLDDKLFSISQKVAELEDIKNKRNENSRKIIQKKTEKDHLSRESDKLQRTLDQLGTEDHTVDFAKYKELQDELQRLNEILLTLQDDRTVMGYAAVLLKDNGIKGKIIETFIPVINQLVNKYLAAFDFFVEFNLDSEFNETILSRHRDNFSYESFSEGEKVRLNLAILFAWREIAKLRSSINCNILVLDELLDSSLDVAGIDHALKVIGNLTPDDNVFIISHREDQIGDKFKKVLRFKKVQGFSRME